MAENKHTADTAPLDLDGLERLAKAAYRDYALADIAVGGGERATVSVPAYITALSPSVALALISQAREAERMRGAASEMVAATDRRWEHEGERKRANAISPRMEDALNLLRSFAAPVTGGGDA